MEVVKGNLSSLYPNSPGGVVNFLSDLSFDRNFVKLQSQFGSYDLMQNGLRMGLLGKNSRFFLSYTYKNYIGYREHGEEFNHLINANYEIYPNSKSSFGVFSNFTRGFIRFPGALNYIELQEDPNQAYNVAASSDFRRDTKKGRLGLRYKTSFDKNNRTELEILGFGAIKDLFFTTNQLYNIRYKYVLGSTARFTSRYPVLKRDNEFTTGADYNYVTGPLSSYTNIGGTKTDELKSQTTESQSNYGAFFENNFNLLKGKFFFLLSGRYDKVNFVIDDELAGFRNSSRSFNRFTPKAAFNYKLTPYVAMYTSYGFGFDTPSAIELENFVFSSNNGLTTINPDINPQTSRNFEIGIKGDVNFRKNKFFTRAIFELTFFNTQVDDEIIPFSISDKVYFRNAAKTNRIGLESGIKIKPVRRTDLIINYTYTNFKYDTYIARTYDAVGRPVDVDYSGNRVPSVPQHLVNFIVEAEPELSEHLELVLIFDADYITKMYVDDENTESVGDYCYANAVAGLSYKSKKVNLILSGGAKNIFDRKFVGYINVNANPELPMYERRFYEPGEPRNYFINFSLNYSF